MSDMTLVDAILTAWREVAGSVASCHAPDYRGSGKETKVFRKLNELLQRSGAELNVHGPDGQLRFQSWAIDLACSTTAHRVAVEGKYKIRSDGAIPDSRKAAFFDLFKLEHYVDSGEYDHGLFLWLTDESRYRQQATGDSADFSTHQGRVYIPGTPLRAMRSRNQMPLPLILKRGYLFDWEPIDDLGGWYSLRLHVANDAT